MSRVTRARSRQAAEAATPAPAPAPPARAAAQARPDLETPPSRLAVKAKATAGGDEENEAPCAATNPPPPATVADLLASPVDVVDDDGATPAPRGEGKAAGGAVLALEAGVARLTLAAADGGGERA